MAINYLDNSPLNTIWNGVEFWNHAPVLMDQQGGVKVLDDRDVMQLRYVAAMLCAGNDDSDNNIVDSMETVEGGASIQGDYLYLNNFDGYCLTDEYTLDCLYINSNNRVCALTVNRDTDALNYWLIY